MRSHHSPSVRPFLFGETISLTRRRCLFLLLGFEYRTDDYRSLYWADETYLSSGMTNTAVMTHSALGADELKAACTNHNFTKRQRMPIFFRACLGLFAISHGKAG